MTIQLYADVSAFNIPNPDWSQYRAWSNRIAMRATYGCGNGYVDKNFSSFRKGAEQAGLAVVFYHYCYPQYNSAEAEAAWFLTNIGTIGASDEVMLDFEETAPQATSEWAIQFLDALAASGYTRSGIYASSSMIQARLQDKRLAPYKLYLADWTYDPNVPPPVPMPWKLMYAWQFTDSYTVPGFGTGCDCNVYVGGPNMTYVEEQAVAVWNAAPKTDPGDETTGIYKAWLANYEEFEPCGPTTLEFPTIDWSNTPITRRDFGDVHIEWYAETGTSRGYRGNVRLW